MRRPLSARKALGFSPLVKAGWAHSSRVERVSFMSAGARPTVLLSGRLVAHGVRQSRCTTQHVRDAEPSLPPHLRSRDALSGYGHRARQHFARSSNSANDREVLQRVGEGARRTVRDKAGVAVEFTASLKIQNPHAVPVNADAAPAPAHHRNISGQPEEKLGVAGLKHPVAVAIQDPSTVTIYADLIHLGTRFPFPHGRRIS